MRLSLIDISIIVIYLISTIFLGIYLSKKASKNINHYFLGGNTIKWWFLGVSDASGMFDIAGTMLLVYWLSVYGLKVFGFPGYGQCLIKYFDGLSFSMVKKI
jgi:Na+/proline symporter